MTSDPNAHGNDDKVRLQCSEAAVAIGVRRQLLIAQLNRSRSRFQSTQMPQRDVGLLAYATSI